MKAFLFFGFTALFHLKYSTSIMTTPKIISKNIMKFKYFPPEPTFILEYNLPKPEQTTTIPMK